MSTPRRAIIGVSAIALAACGSNSSQDPPPLSELPQPGADSSYVGVYGGSASYVAGGVADAGAADGGDSPGWADANAANVTIASHDGTLDRLDVTLAGCTVTATVLSRRYDEGTTTQMPLVLATASVDAGQSCALFAGDRFATVAVDESRLTLFADGSLELVIAGPTSGAASSGPPASYVTYTFEGHKIETVCTTALAETAPPVCSQAGDTTTSIGFVNHCTERAIALFWVDYSCHEVLAAVVAPGGSSMQPTRVTHPWRVRDAKTHELLEEIPPATQATTTYSVP